MEELTLTHSEWNVLDCLWDRSPMTVMELVAALRAVFFTVGKYRY